MWEDLEDRSVASKRRMATFNKDSNTFEKEFEIFLWGLEQRCRKARDSQFLAAGYWDNVNRWLGLSAVLFGVVGGGTAAGTVALGTSWSIPIAAVLSTTAGLLAAANSFLKPSDRMEAHKRAGDGWSILTDKAKKIGQLDIHCMPTPEEMIKKLDAFLEDKKKVTAESPVIPQRMYDKAVRRIEKMDERIKKKKTDEEAAKARARTVKKVNEDDK